MSTTQAARIARIAWLVTFVVPLILVALLLGVESAHAGPVHAVAPIAVDEEFEAEGEGEEEGEFEESECEAAEEEFEEGELGKLEVEQLCDEEGRGAGKAAANGSVAPEECLLRSIHARAVTSPQGELKLTVGYTAYKPIAATLEINAGSVRSGQLHRHLGRSGVLRFVESLGKNHAPHRLVVHIDVPDSPPSCAKFQTEKVSVSGVGGDSAQRHSRHLKRR